VKLVDFPPKTGLSNAGIATQLSEFGFAVIPASSSYNAKRSIDQFNKTIDGFKEFTDEHSYKDISVMGGFAAFGNASSFHNDYVRKLRVACYKKTKPILRLYLRTVCDKPENARQTRNIEKFRMEQMLNRMLQRIPGKTKPVTKEAWHRDEMEAGSMADVSVAGEVGDVSIGGWINLGDTNQSFHCISGSQLEFRGGNSGFGPIKPAEMRRIVGDSKYKPTKVGIPPGSILLFDTTLIHEVASTPKKHWMYRLFVGHRLTTKKTPIAGNKLLNECLSTQGVPGLPSGQITPMYATLNWSNWPGMIETFSKNVIPKLKYVRSLGPKTRKPNWQFLICYRCWPSLEELKLPKYRAYVSEEKFILTPQLLFGSSSSSSLPRNNGKGKEKA
jgi:hypothetical protein